MAALRHRARGLGRPVRGIGEPIWPGRHAAEIAECQLHEALLNIAVHPDVPFWLLCPYDATALPANILDELLHSHPALHDGPAFRGSPTYAGNQHVARLFTRSLPDPPRQVAALPFGTDDVTDVRNRVTRAALGAGVPDERAVDLGAAVTEIATNSVWYAGGGTLRIWREAGGFVCEIRDRGQIADPLVGRRPPPATADGGRGIWLANQLCDLVQIRSASDGTTVRITTWLR